MGWKPERANTGWFIKRFFARPRPEQDNVIEPACPKEYTNQDIQDSTMGNQRIKFDLFIHDLKVPLAVIEAGVISLLEREDKYGSLTDKQIKVLQRVLRNTKMTKSLVNDAMEIGRANSGIIIRDPCLISNLISRALSEIFDLTDQRTAEFMRECASLADFREALKDKGIRIHIGEDLWTREVRIDESKMKQILRNLLSNALKYRKEMIDLTVELGEGFFSVAVADDGQGIPENYHKQIFECYFQMDMKEQHCVRGHGLGLAGVSVLVEDMNGKLSLLSDSGKGATFIVEIPL